ncbi:MAG: hypothetical protein ACE5H1_01165 [Thermodesulfobacteriota bacterium]
MVRLFFIIDFLLLSVCQVIGQINSPKDLPHLVCWYTVDSLVANNNDLIDLWTSQGGSGEQTLTSFADGRPTFKTNVLNGKSGLFFDGLTNHLKGDSLSSWKFFNDGSSSLSYFVVFKPISDATGMTIFDNTSLTSSNIGFYLQYRRQTTPPRIDSAITKGVAGNRPIWLDTYYIPDVDTSKGVIISMKYDKSIDGNNLDNSWLRRNGRIVDSNERIHSFAAANNPS